MKYVKRCLALLMACVVTAALVQPTTWAKYTTASDPEVLSFTLDTAQTKYTIDNTIQQGNLTTLSDNEWPSSYDSTSKTSSGSMICTAVAGEGMHIKDTDSRTYYNVWLRTETAVFTEGHEHYLRARIKIVTNSSPLTFRVSTTSPVNSFKYSGGDWETISCRFDNPSTGGYLRIGADASSTFEWYISHVMLIDLTKTFGAGNEPPQWWCDKYIPWQDETTSGTKTVQWFPKASMSALDTAFHNGSTGYYAVSNRKNVATVDANGKVTLSGTDTDVNSTSLGNP